jgi:hypothetical protein
MKKLAILAGLAAAFTTAPAFASDKITLAQAMPLSTALQNLDGHMIVIKQNGQDAAIMTPWEFGSGSLRLRIANDLTIVNAALKTAEETRQAVIKELLKKASDRTGSAVTEIKPDMPESADYQKQYLDLMAQPASGTQDLGRIKASELRLDKNEIPVTVLSALKPIMDE